MLLLHSVKKSMIVGNLNQVLVDAECTHDGSIKHIQKFEHWGWTTMQRRVLDAERTDNLTTLQVWSTMLLCFYFVKDLNVIDIIGKI